MNMYELLKIWKGLSHAPAFLVLYLYLIGLVMSNYWHPIWQKQMLYWVMGWGVGGGRSCGVSLFDTDDAKEKALFQFLWARSLIKWF